MERVCGLQWMKRKKRDSIHDRDDASLNTLYVVEFDNHRRSKGTYGRLEDKRRMHNAPSMLKVHALAIKR